MRSPEVTLCAALLTAGCHRPPATESGDAHAPSPTKTAAAVGDPGAAAHAQEVARPMLQEVARPMLIKDGDAVFFIGNSFFGWNDRPLPEWVAALGRAVTPPIRIEIGSDIVFGNTPLAKFLEHPATRRALASGKYKVFVLQAEEYEPVDHKAAFHQAVRDFDRAIVAAGGRTVLFMTWEFPWRRFIDQLSASYDEIGAELGIPVIPVGLLYGDCQRSHPASPYWLTADEQHPRGDLHENEKGTALNAYATFEMLTGINPHGKNFTAPGNTNGDALMRYLSDTAWNRIAPRLGKVR